MKSVKINYFFIIISFVFCHENIFSQENSTSISNDRQNFIFYLADDQDLLDYGCYGNPNVSTSNVDKLAEEGMKFTNFHTAQAICAPSRSQIFTGMYPVKNGCMANHIGVKPNIKSIATLLKDAGYEVVLAGKSHVKPNKVFNWTHYFKNLEHRYLPLEKIDNYLKNVKKPFCLFITSDYPHGPFPKTSEYAKKDIYQLPYDNGRVGNHKPGYYKNIKDDNIQLGKILKMVDSYNLSNNSMFIYASDHGLSGKWGLAEQGLKVPFIVRWPGHVKPNSTSHTLLSFVDVLPTLLAASKTEIPKNIDGKSFLNILKGDKAEVHKYIFGVATKQNIRNAKVFPSRMVKNNSFKLIRNFNAKEVLASNLGENQIVNEFIKMGANSFPNKPYEELYDLKNDPYQKNNLINNKKYKNERLQLSNALVTWMTAQNDFLLMDTMPLLKPTLHPLDKNTKWTKVPNELEGKLTAKDYIKIHY